MLQLKALGSPQLLGDDGQPVGEVASQTKRLVLLTYLAAGDPAGCRRDVLLAAFWPELDDSHARNALRQALAMLRKALGDDVLPADGAEAIRLNPARISCDVTTFLDALARQDPRAALAVYRGDFLAGVHVSDLPEIERWMDGRRDGLRRKAVRAAFAIADQRSTLNSRISWAHQAVTMSPHDETAWRRLIEFQIAAGNVPQALETYDRLCRLLAEEFETVPSPETQALVAPLRRAPA
jgi:DNA-binding SARP family transcriptional activator